VRLVLVVSLLVGLTLGPAAASGAPKRTEGDRHGARIERLIAKHQHLATRRVDRFFFARPDGQTHWLRDALISAAHEALWQAAKDAETGEIAHFAGYARQAIDWAISKAWQEHGELSVHYRRQAKAIRRSERRVAGTSGLPARAEATAAEMGISPEKLARLQRRIRRDRRARTPESLSDEPHQRKLHQGSSPEEILAQAETRAQLGAAIERLPWPMRQVIAGFDLDQRPAAELARELGLALDVFYKYRREALTILADIFRVQNSAPWSPAKEVHPGAQIIARRDDPRIGELIDRLPGDLGPLIKMYYRDQRPIELIQRELSIDDLLSFHSRRGIALRLLKELFGVQDGTRAEAQIGVGPFFMLHFGTAEGRRIVAALPFPMRTLLTMYYRDKAAVDRICDRLQISKDEFDKVSKKAALTLFRRVFEARRGHGPSVDASLETAFVLDRLVDAKAAAASVALLPALERTLIASYFDRELTLQQIAARVKIELRYLKRDYLPRALKLLRAVHRGEATDPEAVFLRGKHSEPIKAIVARLPPAKRRFARLYYYEERSPAEIAVALGLKPSSVPAIKLAVVKRLGQELRRAGLLP
jgi:RNA polymerase sigma factor for flagellar operon FliA